MNRLDKIEEELLIIRQKLCFDSAESFKEISRSVFEGTANLQEELVLLKMQVENHEIEFNKLKRKINEIIDQL